MNEKTARALLEKVKFDYDSIAYDFSKSRDCFWHEFSEFLPFISDHFGKMDDRSRLNGSDQSFPSHEPLRILDLGCGNGRLFGFLSNSLKNGFEYTGIDNSVAIIHEAQKRYGRDEASGGVPFSSALFLEAKKCVRHRSQLKPRFIVSDMLFLPFHEMTFDTVFSLASLHHIPSRAFRIKALNEIHRVLKSDSICIFLIWNLWQKKYFVSFLRSFIRFIVTLGQYDFNDLFIPWQDKIFRYYHAFTFFGLKRIVKKNGFKILYSSKGRNFIIIAKKI
ncbi:methyltransferase domain-containing protein [Candidatus Peregrinibacteria bacterium]|nr:methyltransferase domain-containing protein [Candidatus Peregrinibacteria bacterium]